MCGAHKTIGWSQPLFALSHVVKLVFLCESYLLVSNCLHLVGHLSVS